MASSLPLSSSTTTSDSRVRIAPLGAHAAEIENLIATRVIDAVQTRRELSTTIGGRSSGRGACLLIQGASGAGKSTLVANMTAKLRKALADASSPSSSSSAAAKSKTQQKLQNEEQKQRDDETVSVKKLTAKDRLTFENLAHSLAAGSVTMKEKRRTKKNNKVSKVVLRCRSVDTAKALSNIYTNDSTMLHTEIFGHSHFTGAAGSNSHDGDETSSTHFSFPLPTSSGAAQECEQREDEEEEVVVHLNIVTWDHFDLFFAKDGGAASSSSATKGDDSTGSDAPTGLSLIPEFSESERRFYLSGDVTRKGNADSREAKATSFRKNNGEDEKNQSASSSSVRPFAASPELLAHFLNISSRIKGSHLSDFKPRSNNVKTQQQRQDPSDVVKASPPPRTVKSISLTFLFALSSTVDGALFDPLLIQGPCFDYRLELLTPTEEERRDIIMRRMGGNAEAHAHTDGKDLNAKAKNNTNRSLHRLFEHVTAVAAAKLGGCSVEYCAFAGDYLKARLVETDAYALFMHGSNHNHTACTHGIDDDDEESSDLTNVMPPALLSRLNLQVNTDLNTFDGLWNGASAAGADSSQAETDGDAVASSSANHAADRKVGYTDVQKVLWSDIAGLEPVKRQLQRLVLSVKHKDKYLAMGVEPSIGAIIYGPPGTGKTMLAKAMATEMLASFIYLDLPELINGAIGESEKILREFFAVAKERSPCIMFIDEIQSAFSVRYDKERGGNNSAHDARLVTTLLSLLDEARLNFFSHPIIFLGATNWIEVIDGAILRPGRLDTHIYVGPPDAEARLALIERYVEQQWPAWVPLPSSSPSSASESFSSTTTTSAAHNMSSFDYKNYHTALVEALCCASVDLTGAEIKNGLNEFAMRIFVGDRFGIEVPNGSEEPFADFMSLFNTHNGEENVSVRKEIVDGLKTCFKKLRE